MPLDRIKRLTSRVFSYPLTLLRLHRHRHKSTRFLEIGPGNERLRGFETLSIEPKSYVDYVLDCSKLLPFRDNTFDLIYASHVLEHIPWYKTEETLREWVRIIKAGGILELWVPNGLKICQVLLDAELEGKDNTHLDGWYKFNPDRDPCIWAAGRIYTYGDGSGNPRSPNWHRAFFTPRYLRQLLGKVGLREIRELDRQEVRGHDHGWINLGMAGVK